MSLRSRRFATDVLLLILLVLIGLVALNRQNISDWWKLRGYTPPSSVVTLASETTMTPKAEHLFYLNRPTITNSAVFSDNCPNNSEKTIVLGCYKDGDNGIYIYKVTDPRLQGVEQVTAAHEMLHAVYARLSAKERTHVDEMLVSYYQNDVKDPRIISTMNAYKQSEPGQLDNEMHSVFGTEIANLPTDLEAYYDQYFTDRNKITSYAADYQSEFTSRESQVADYDSQLSSIKTQITADEADLASEREQLNTESAKLSSQQSAGDVQAYNAGVAGYNAQVAHYNGMVQTVKDLINNYNSLVEKRNAIVLEEQQLSRAITASPERVQ